MLYAPSFIQHSNIQWSMVENFKSDADENVQSI